MICFIIEQVIGFFVTVIRGSKNFDFMESVLDIFVKSVYNKVTESKLSIKRKE